MKMVHQPLPKDFNPEYKMGIDRALRIIEILSELLESEDYVLDIDEYGISYRKYGGEYLELTKKDRINFSFLSTS